nr:unnamed protein product [Callosobruchus chinensis]
MQSREYQFD